MLSPIWEGFQLDARTWICSYLHTRASDWFLESQAFNFIPDVIKGNSGLGFVLLSSLTPSFYIFLVCWDKSQKSAHQSLTLNTLAVCTKIAVFSHLFAYMFIQLFYISSSCRKGWFEQFIQLQMWNIHASERTSPHAWEQWQQEKSVRRNVTLCASVNKWWREIIKVWKLATVLMSCVYLHKPLGQKKFFGWTAYMSLSEKQFDLRQHFRKRRTHTTSMTGLHSLFLSIIKN